MWALREFAPPAGDTFDPMPYVMLQSLVDDAVPAGMPAYARSECPLDDAGIDTLATAAAQMTLADVASAPARQGGAIARVPKDATAFRFREAAAMLTLAAMWPDSADPGHQHRDWARTTWQQMRPRLPAAATSTICARKAATVSARPTGQPRGTGSSPSSDDSTPTTSSSATRTSRQIAERNGYPGSASAALRCYRPPRSP